LLSIRNMYTIFYIYIYTNIILLLIAVSYITSLTYEELFQLIIGAPSSRPSNHGL
jgi:hypothetical protein